MKPRSEPTPTNLLPALQTHRWFASCQAPFQEALIARSRLVYLQAGESLFSRGGPPEALCCVIAGALKLGSVNPADGSQRLTLYVEPYHWFGEIALIDQLPRSQDAVADIASTVLDASPSRGRSARCCGSGTGPEYSLPDRAHHPSRTAV